MDKEAFENERKLDNKNIPSPRLQTREGASEYLMRVWGMKFAPTTLAKLATLGGGPKYHKAGRTPLYPEEQLDSFAREKLGPLQTSTSGLPDQASADRNRLGKPTRKHRTDGANDGGTQC